MGIYELELCGTKEQFHRRLKILIFAGSQCWCVSIGVTGSLPFACFTSLAALFLGGTVYNFESSLSLMWDVIRRALHKSILAVTNTEEEKKKQQRHELK